MGVSAHISFDQWPKQGTFLNLRAEVCFRYDTERVVMGTIVRNDSEGDGITIIKLDDGRFVLGTECQYRPIYGSAHEPTSAQVSKERLAQALRNLRDVAHREADVGPGGGVRATHATGSAPSKPGAAEPPTASPFEFCVFIGDPPSGYASWSDWAAEPTKRYVTIRASETKDAGGCGACDKPGEHCANVHGICSRHGGRAHETKGGQS